jgi:hypothetical protein
VAEDVLIQSDSLPPPFNHSDTPPYDPLNYSNSPNPFNLSENPPYYSLIDGDSPPLLWKFNCFSIVIFIQFSCHYIMESAGERNDSRVHVLFLEL